MKTGQVPEATRMTRRGRRVRERSGKDRRRKGETEETMVRAKGEVRSNGNRGRI